MIDGRRWDTFVAVSINRKRKKAYIWFNLLKKKITLDLHCYPDYHSAFCPVNCVEQRWKDVSYGGQVAVFLGCYYFVLRSGSAHFCEGHAYLPASTSE